MGFLFERLFQLHRLYCAYLIVTILNNSIQICILTFHIVSWSGKGGKGSYLNRLITIMPAYCVSRICWDTSYTDEVDHFNDLDDLFQNSGFKGVYKAHTGEALNGCAVFWKDNLFKLLHQEDIEFQRFGMRNNVAQLCVFEANHEKKESDACNLTSIAPSTGKRRFVVGNIHVLFNPNCGDIKLGQVRLLLDKAYKLSQEWGNIPVIIAGDLNSVPQVCAIYKFLSSSKVSFASPCHCILSSLFAYCCAVSEKFD
ncbi:Carbon catabolite repressor protein 4 5 [Glycine max]|nr:Carbon catabolite repressor protein 4 5 [Glycine max]